MVAERNTQDLRRFVNKGGLNTDFGTLVGGTFLVGFALALGAQDSQIGLLAAIPPLLNLVQIVGSYLVSKVGSSKQVCLITAGIFRLVWLGLICIPVVLFRETAPGWAITLLISVLALASLFASLSGIAWMAWIA